VIAETWSLSITEYATYYTKTLKWFADWGCQDEAEVSFVFAQGCPAQLTSVSYSGGAGLKKAYELQEYFYNIPIDVERVLL
jgi:hypothetical protein